MMKLTRQGVILLGAGAFLGAEWLGEGRDNPLPRLAILAGLVALVVAVATLCWRPASIRAKVAVSAIFVVLAGSGFWTGDQVAGAAFNSCVAHGEDVRQALEHFRAQNRTYPASLRELPGALPGKRLLRPNILSYERRDGGYSLSFSDWLVSHAATEREGWLATK